MSFEDFKRKLPKWERRVKKTARDAWKVLWEFADWWEQRQGKTFEVNVPTDEKVRIEGFPVNLRGMDGLSDYQKKKLPEYIDILKAGLKHYRSRASQVLPLLLKRGIPIEADFRCTIGEGGEYRNKNLMVCPSAFENPKRMAHIMAHEMGHHLWRTYLSGADQEAWYRFISGNLGKLDLMDAADTAEKYGDRSLFNNKGLKKKDPILYLQLMGLYDNPYTKKVMQNILNPDQLREAVLDGRLPKTVNVQSKPISGYAASNPEEAFCEAVGLLVAYGPAAVFGEVRSMLGQILPVKA